MRRRRCACGCGEWLKRNAKAYASRACVPRSVRVAGGKKGGAQRIAKGRLRLFGDELKRLIACQPMTREDVLVAFAAVYRKGYHAGQFRRERRPKGKAA